MFLQVDICPVFWVVPLQITSNGCLANTFHAETPRYASAQICFQAQWRSPNTCAELFCAQDAVPKSLWKSQRRSLAWMIKMEVNGSPAGGMLCDEQGLGKTPTTVCLMATRTFERVKVRYNSHQP